ncbi:hypothetical protein CEN46_03275, partial [Fischerella thermalis CCMEE 5318]
MALQFSLYYRTGFPVSIVIFPFAIDMRFLTNILFKLCKFNITEERQRAEGVPHKFALRIA